ncbi:SUMO-specific isopeptidase USPL1 [Sorex fumeus]|uniref:SUMO-specific isopeptidase USPL1 n=1 Tax=Sorex fumeus TaxID=62283 RepID=UPI0024AD4B41|nr:SUMO-specific isopeptidase USPL1 [Sorex fumeus]
MMDSQKIGNGLPVIGPGTDIGKSSLHMVGYLGKSYDSAKVPSDGYCPACREKGKLKALKTYRISFQESIFLCEDLQCIYPLGFKSLQNLISPDLDDCHTPNKPQKRKVLETNCQDLVLSANSKKTKHQTDDEHALKDVQSGEVYARASPSLQAHPQQNSFKTTDKAQTEILETDLVEVAVDGAPPRVSVSGPGETSPRNEGCASQPEPSSEGTVVAQTSYVQWENAYALCWLDCILSALVHLQVLKNKVLDLCAQEESVFRRLFARFREANKLLHSSRLDPATGGECKKLNSEVFRKIETSLNEIRDDIFTRLQPQLRCTLGDMESPVFAFPLLLKMEPQVENLFKYSFSWNFECSQCGHKYQNRCTKNLVTFTNVIPKWHPLNAVHFGPCNNCSSKPQIRKMVLENLSSVFMLHFVEGLPQNDLQCYSFHFEGCLYQITSVIQYQANNHFITWILGADGSWLECDDLKGPCSKRREKFEVPASEIHIVIWERKISQMTDKAAACLPRKKIIDQHALGGERQVSAPVNSVGQTASAKISSSVHTVDVSVAPKTHSQDAAVAPSDTSVNGNIFLLTLEEIKANSEGFLLDNRPVAEATGPVKLDTRPSCESVRPLVSAAGRAPLSPGNCAALSSPPAVVNSSTQSGPLSSKHFVGAGTVGTDPAAGPTQGVKSVEMEGSVGLETNASLEQFLPPKTQSVELVPHSSPEVNLKKETVVASQTVTVKSLPTPSPKVASRTVTVKSLPTPSPKENQKKPFVGSWVKGLLSRGVSFMPPCVTAHSRNAVTDLQPSVKGACNFGGFKTKGTNQKASRAAKKTHRSTSKSSSGMICHPPADVSISAEVCKKAGNTSSGTQLNHSSPETKNGVSCDNGASAANHRDSVEAQIHKLRLKLLKKLKAKKKKLAALSSSPKNGTLPSGNSEPVTQGSPNECESIEDLLKELQYQIDMADNKSACPDDSSVSPCSGQTHEEILAELLSPAAVVSTELSENGEADFRYLEMGDNHIPAPVTSELSNIPPDTPLRQDHNYCSPSKKNQCRVQLDSPANDACVRSLSLESTLKTDIFDEFFSTSAFESLANDTLDLPHFDEYLFESC